MGEASPKKRRVLMLWPNKFLAAFIAMRVSSSRVFLRKGADCVALHVTYLSRYQTIKFLL
jgi:hypothetical protein